MIRSKYFSVSVVILLAFFLNSSSCRREPCPEIVSNLKISKEEVEIGQGVGAILICPGDNAHLNWTVTGAALAELSMDTDGDGDFNNQIISELSPIHKMYLTPQSTTAFMLKGFVSEESSCVRYSSRISANIIPENGGGWRIELQEDGLTTYAGVIPSIAASENIVVD